MKKIRFIPYGYTVHNGQTIINCIEAEVIRQIYMDYIAGASLKEIADNLTLQEIPYTEKTTVWDKARIARIIDNVKYIGTDEYEPIIDAKTYEQAVSIKKSRQRGTAERDNAAINVIRDYVVCAECGSHMIRRICSNSPIKKRWVCSNRECGNRTEISDTDFLQKVTIIMNRIIDNAELIVPKSTYKQKDSATLLRYQNDIINELNRPNPDEERIITKIRDIASLLYSDSQANKTVAGFIGRKKVMRMKCQDSFNSQYFSEIVAYICLDRSGRVTVHTKTETCVEEGADKL